MESTEQSPDKPVSTAGRRQSEPNWFARACAHEDASRFQQALHCYRRVLQREGPSASVLFNLGNVYYGLRRRQDAVVSFRQSLTLDPRSHECWNNLGVVFCEMRECGAAVSALQRAIALAPWFADAIFNLADCFEERHLHAEARRHWENYVRLDAGSQWAQHARDKLG